MLRIGFAGLLLSAGIEFCGAQSPAVQCVASVAPPPIVRQEGVTELVADLLLTCTGGTPTLAGQTIPQVNIKLTLNTAVTSKLLSNGGSEALLLIDDPLGPSNPQTPQIGCTNVTNGCPVQGTGGVPNPFTLPGNPNVFEGRQTSPNSLEWDAVPIDPPGASPANRVFRITNVRANANQLGVSGGAIPLHIAGFISLLAPAGNILLGDPQHTLAFVQPSLTLGTVPASLQQCPAVNGGNLFNPIPAGHGATFHLLVKEQSPNAFKRRNIATNLSDPSADSVQNVPGTIPPYVESGFIPDANSGLPPGVGAVDFGTLIQVNLFALPSGVSIQVPAVVPLTATGARAGTAITLTSGGTAIGSEVQFTPPLGAGSVVFYLEVVDTASTTTSLKLLDLSVALIGQAAAVPAQVSATASFASAVNSQTTLFALDSPHAPLRPIFQPVSDPGIVAPLNPYLAGATIVDCNNNTPSLTASGAARVDFIEGPGTVVPASFNIGIVSTGPPVPNVAASTDPPAAWLNMSLNQTTTPVTATFSVNLSGAPSNASTNVIFTGSSLPGTPLTVPVTLAAAVGPWFTRYGIANLGSYVNNAIAPGEPFVLFGANEFGPSPLAGAALDPSGLVSSMLGNTQVLFDSTPAPLLYAVDANGFGQIAGFAPFALDGKSQTLVQVVYNSVASPAVALPVLDAIPGLLTADQSGGGPGAVLNQDGTMNGPATPEAVGNIVTLYGGGAGQTTPPGRDGAFAGVGADLSTLNLSVKVFIDGILASDVPYAGPAPQMEEGIFQINVRIPQGVGRPGNLPVLVQVGDKTTQPGVTVSVK